MSNIKYSRRNLVFETVRATVWGASAIFVGFLGCKLVTGKPTHLNNFNWTIIAGVGAVTGLTGFIKTLDVNKSISYTERLEQEKENLGTQKNLQIYP